VKYNNKYKKNAKSGKRSKLLTVPSLAAGLFS